MTSGPVKVFHVIAEAGKHKQVGKIRNIQCIDITLGTVQNQKIVTTGYIDCTKVGISRNLNKIQILHVVEIQIDIQIHLPCIQVHQVRATLHVQFFNRIDGAIQPLKFTVTVKIQNTNLIIVAAQFFQIIVVRKIKCIKLILFAIKNLKLVVILYIKSI